MNSKKPLREYIKEHNLIFDGAMGTMIQKKKIEITNNNPDLLNISHKEAIRDIHNSYVANGCQVITTCTFNSNPIKLKEQGILESSQEIIKAAVENAKSVNPDYVALDIGPIGQLISPRGTVSFEEAYDSFKEQVLTGVKMNVDVLLFETFSDIYELKIAILAAKENSTLPIFATMTYQENGRTFLGTDPISATITLDALGIDALGVNCSLGPNELLPIVENICQYSSTPVMVQANTGLPNLQGEYTMDKEEFVTSYKTMAKYGVSIFGGCCGSDETFIKSISEFKHQEKTKNKPKKITVITSGTKHVIFNHNVNIIGERINPTGKPRLKEAMLNNDKDYIIKEAYSQINAGATVLDVNCGIANANEPKLLKETVLSLQSCIDVPLQLDSSNYKALEEALRVYTGKALINSVNAKSESLEAVLPLAKKYGACVLGLCLDETGIPKTPMDRFNAAKKIVDTAVKYGMKKEDVLIDALVLSVGSNQEDVMVTLETIKLIKEKLGVCCVLGISNVSFGMPNRHIINSAFLAMALQCGLDAPIINPLNKRVIDTINSYNLLSNKDKNATLFIKAYSDHNDEVSDTNNTIDLKESIIKGLAKDSKSSTADLLGTVEPNRIINEYIIPALNTVGELYEQEKLFLPSLMQSAKAAQSSFDLIKERLGSKSVQGEKIILATVEGDIHDIGKNIVKMLLENYGYKVIDMGKNIKAQDILSVAISEDVKLIGLSALMTTTVKTMLNTIKLLNQELPSCKVMVGGAVLTKEYSKEIGADYYGKDAQEAVKIAKNYFNH